MLTRLLKPLIDRSPTLAALYRQRRDGRALRGPMRDSVHGFRFCGHASMLDGSFEPDETRLVKRLLDDCEVVINVGANIGYYCCLALQAGKQVVAFEPVALNVAYLLRNVAANGWSQAIEVYPIALGEAAGIAEIFGGSTGASLIAGWGGNRQSEGDRVPLSSLDLVLGDRFDGRRCLVIVDIEGAELAMLKGAGRLLAQRPRPVWLVEVTIGEHLPAGQRINPHLEETFALFAGHGYAAMTADAAPRPVAAAELAAIVASGEDTLNTHNFLFYDPAMPPAALA